MARTLLSYVGLDLMCEEAIERVACNATREHDQQIGRHRALGTELGERVPVLRHELLELAVGLGPLGLDARDALLCKRFMIRINQQRMHE